MKHCPTAKELEQFLDEQLSDDRHERFADHIASCAPCQATLERLTEPTATARSVSLSTGRHHDEGCSALPASATSFLAQLMASPPRSHSQTPLAGSLAEKTSLPEPPVINGYELFGEIG